MRFVNIVLYLAFQMMVMMKRALAAIVCTGCLLSVQASCRTGKDTTSAQTSAQADVYDVVVSFFSIGAGVDYKKKQAFDAFLQAFEQKHALTLKKESFPWGREGETDVCLRFTGISKDQKKMLLQGIKDVVAGSELIRISEQTTCPHKR
jgi:ABC-type glycerol-3-phosphate transport system substrate-binding protein